MKPCSENRNYLLGVDKSTLQRYQIFNQLYQPATEKGFASLSTQPDMQILEVGCGITAFS